MRNIPLLHVDIQKVPRYFAKVSHLFAEVSRYFAKVTRLFVNLFVVQFGFNILVPLKPPFISLYLKPGPPIAWIRPTIYKDFNIGPGDRMACELK